MGGKWEGGLGRGTHVNPWLIHVNVWQKPLQYCKVISPQLIKINEKKINFVKSDQNLCRLVNNTVLLVNFLSLLFLQLIFLSIFRTGLQVSNLIKLFF